MASFGVNTAATPPNSRVPISDDNGNVSPAWYRFFTALTGAPAAASTVALSGSPFSFAANVRGSLLIHGGTVSAVNLTRGRFRAATGVTNGIIPVSQGDVVEITYSLAPDVAFFPA